MRNILVTPAIIEAACDALKKQLTGVYVAKDKLDISVPTKITLTADKKPVILVSKIADKKMRALVEQCDKEIAWHGSVDYDQESNTYLIEDIFVFPQEITGATVESIDEKYGPWLMELDDETFNKLRLHGHSHVNMGTFPSGIDVAYQENLVCRIQDFYIFVILNKKEDYYVCMYDIANNLMYDKADLVYDTEIDAEDLWAKQAIADKVVEKVVKTTYTSTRALDSVLKADIKKYNAVSQVYKPNWHWEMEFKAYVPNSMVDLLKWVNDTMAEDVKAKKPKKNTGRGKNNGVLTEFQRYQKERIAALDKEKKQKNNSAYGTICDGVCETCQATCAYRY